MIFFRILVITFLLNLGLALPAVAEIPLGSPPSQKGMTLGLFSKENNYNYYEDLKEMKAYGITHILLVVSWYQQDIYSTELKPMEFDHADAMTIPDAKLIEVIQQASSLGLKTSLFPIVRLMQRKGGEWRGVLKPKDLAQWFFSYETFILHYANLAKSYGVDMLSVGSELGSLEKEKDRWVALIQKIRTVFPGKLIYSANWDHYQKVTFWDQLDYIGMTAYYELTKIKNPTYTQLINSWRTIRNHLLQWKQQYKQPLIFTEIGYLSIDGTNIYPWNYFAEEKVDLEEQALCYRAFARAWGSVPQLGGVYFWVWWGNGGPQDKSYTPRNKPAGEVVKEWYQKS
ncbi:MAG: hypothetical protein HYU97_02525 [Deltaproteobacteria bacterium]|nr:hypothetical protein [Deltaproteobacteria bacterium]